MPEFQLNPDQQKLVQMDPARKIFLSGPAGSGKTTAAIARLEYLFGKESSADSFLILVPQRTLAKPYYDFAQGRKFVFKGEPTILTLGGLARRMVDLFWPLAARECGFESTTLPPTFLTIETAQYFLAKVMEPLLAKGYFSGINIEPNRLAGQILDNMNKATVIGFPLEEIASRLKDGSPQEIGLWAAFQQAQECALLFREYCLKYNLLDYSLQMEVFLKHLWPMTICLDYLLQKYHHLVYDNVEEDVPAAHDWVRSWADKLESLLLVYDENGGFRTFLGADAESGRNLASICKEQVVFQQTYTSSAGIQDLSKALRENILLTSKPQPAAEVFEQFTFEQFHFYPEMIEEVCREVKRLIENGESASDMVILSPFLSDSLLFSLTTKLAENQIPSYAARPSRALVREPVIHCLVAFAKLAHPNLQMSMDAIELRQALMTAIEGMDVVRAQLICKALFNERHLDAGLGSFNNLKGGLPERITYLFGERVEKIRTWLNDYKEGEVLPLFGFWSRLFGEVLSQPGFGFHQDFNAAELTARLILSAKRFRQLMLPLPGFNEIDCGREYIALLQSGLLGALFFEADEHPQAVLIAPAFTYLMTNRPVKYQFWLDIGSNGWWERLNQPLTHPYVLSRQWPGGTPWQDSDEIKANQITLARLVDGLLNRCSRHLYLYMAGMDDQGREQRNQLLQAFNLLYRRAAREKADNRV